MTSAMPSYAAPAPEQRIDLQSPRTRADTGFRAILIAASSAVLLSIVGIVVYLSKSSALALSHVGPWRMITGTLWAPPSKLYGFGGDLVGSFVIAVIALLFAVPISLATALGINEYVPRRVRTPLVALVDLLAAVPSLVYGFWGKAFLANHVFHTSQFLGHDAPFFPLFRLTGTGKNTVFSEFDAGLVVAIMVLPLMTAVAREVMSQTPREDCEAALALGGTRWGMITDVIMPFSRNGIVGGAMLSFGRALGETIAVSLILSADNKLTSHILQPDGGSVSALIATQFAGASKMVQSALTFAALTLFAITLSVNLFARMVIARSVRAR
jgi:phosphate transport system permease protein